MQLSSHDKEERLKQLLNEKQLLENQCVRISFVPSLQWN